MKMFSSNFEVLPGHCFLLSAVHAFLVSWFWWVRSTHGWNQVKEAWTWKESKTMGLGKKIFCFNSYFATLKISVNLHMSTMQWFCTHVCNYLKAYWLIRESLPTAGDASVSWVTAEWWGLLPEIWCLRGGRTTEQMKCAFRKVCNVVHSRTSVEG